VLSAEHLLEEEHYSEADCFELLVPFSLMLRDQAASATE
jgi:hypothetical protein